MVIALVRRDRGLMGPRDWQAPETDKDPDGEWVHHDHGFSWGGKGQVEMSRFEYHTRTFIKWGWVAMFVILLIAMLVK